MSHGILGHPRFALGRLGSGTALCVLPVRLNPSHAAQCGPPVVVADPQTPAFSGELDGTRASTQAGSRAFQMIGRIVGYLKGQEKHGHSISVRSVRR